MTLPVPYEYRYIQVQVKLLYPVVYSVLSLQSNTSTTRTYCTCTYNVYFYSKYCQYCNTGSRELLIQYILSVLVLSQYLYSTRTYRYIRVRTSIQRPLLTDISTEVRVANIIPIRTVFVRYKYSTYRYTLRALLYLRLLYTCPCIVLRTCTCIVEQVYYVLLLNLLFYYL